MRAELDFPSVLAQWPLLAKGVAWTVGLSVVASVIGVAVGVVLAWTRSQGPAWAKAAAGTYVELIRNTPFIVQLFFVFFWFAGSGRQALGGSGVHHCDGDQPVCLRHRDHSCRD